MARENLPNRRRCVTLEFEYVNPAGQSFPLVASLGYYHDGRLGEVFVASATKLTTDVDINARDSAIALSLGLQHGAPVEVLVPAFLRDAGGHPEGILGQLMEAARREKLLSTYAFSPDGASWR